MDRTGGKRRVLIVDEWDNYGAGPSREWLEQTTGRWPQALAKSKGKKDIPSPCERCKRKPNCPRVCYPKRDWERGQRRRAKHEPF